MAKKIYKSPPKISQINKKLMEIKESKFGRVVTENIAIQQKYPSMIIERGKNAGSIRTYSQYKEIVEKRASTQAKEKGQMMTKQEYDATVRELQQEIANRSTVTKEDAFQRQFMLDALNRESLNLAYDVNALSTQELLDIFREAEKIQHAERETEKGSYESNRFWEDIGDFIYDKLKEKGLIND